LCSTNSQTTIKLVRSVTGVAPSPGFFVWQIPGETTSIQLNLDVVDRLQYAVMQGFSAVPRRGAEVGGILLGAVEGSRVRVDNYQLVPIQYKHGPSYRFSEHDAESFDQAVRASLSGKTRAIGYFRSHTRNGTGLSDEDLALVSRYFPQTEAIVLLIRPFATKPSLAGFYAKKDGSFRNSAPEREFPLRRQDLAAEPIPSLPPVQAAVARIRIHRPALPPPRAFRILMLISLFLLVMVLAYQSAATRTNRNPFQIAMSVQESGSDLQIQWPTETPAIRFAQKGRLTIEDGSYKGVTNMTRADLEIGSAGPYRPRTSHVRLRLDVFLNPQNSISVTADWRLLQTKERRN
jgi:hypothetical protein